MDLVLKLSVLASFALLVLGCNGIDPQTGSEDARTSPESAVLRDTVPGRNLPGRTTGRDNRGSMLKITEADDASEFRDTYHKTMAKVRSMIDTLRYRQSRRADTISVQYCSLSVVRDETNITIIEDDIIENYSGEHNGFLGSLPPIATAEADCLRDLIDNGYDSLRNH